MQAVILAAGAGSRLRPLTLDTPKTLLPLHDLPLIEHILNALPDTITEIILVVGYKRVQVHRRLGSTWKGRPIQYVLQTKQAGTGDALHRTKQYLHNRFLVLNGDDLYTKADLERLIAHPIAILLHTTMAPILSSALLDKAGNFVGIENHAPAHEEKRQICGAYVLDERFFHYPLVSVLVRGRQELSVPHTLVELSKDIPVHAEQASWWQPVGTLAELQEARAHLSYGSCNVTFDGS